MTDLVVWLRQQLDTDEQRARRAAANHPDWSYDRETFTVSTKAYVIAARKADSSPLNDVDGEHIATNDPARVLRQVQAHRAILDLHQPCDDEMPEGPYCSSCGDAPQVRHPCATLRALASIYSDRDGYREEWSA